MENVTGLQRLPAMPKVIVRYHPPEVERPEIEDNTLVILPNGQVSPESFA